jgi:hypothetical protein
VVYDLGFGPVALKLTKRAAVRRSPTPTNEAGEAALETVR